MSTNLQHLSGSTARWAWRVALTIALCGAAAAVTGSGLVALLIALAATSWWVGRAIVGIIASEFRELWQATSERQLRVGRYHSDELIDALTHDPFRAAREALHATRIRAGGSAAVDAALGGIDAIELALRETTAARGAHRIDTSGALLLGGVALETKEEHAVTKLYGDPLTAPVWLPPGPRDLVLQAGRVLDDVRLLHTIEIEWAVLLFTVWARAALVALAPMLGALSFAPVPLSGGFDAADMPWVAASAWAVGCALIAPRIATAAMERSPRAARARRVLLAVEVPLACVLAMTSPSWMVVAFAAGWTNWWQRQWNDPLEPAEFNWPRLAAYVGLVAATQAVGLAIASVPAAEAAAEMLATLAVIGMIGGSYGAMFPVSLSVLIQVIGGAIVGHRRAARTAGSRIEQSISDLLAAASAIEADSGPDDEVARRDAVLLRDVARQLRLREDLADRVLRRTPRGLESLLEDALRGAGTIADSPEAGRVRADADREGRPEPVTFGAPSLSPRALRQAKVVRRGHARTLRRIVTRCAIEARVHGTGELQTLLRADGDRIVLRFANAPSPEPGPAGRGRGRRELEGLVESLPGGDLAHRGLVDSRFVEGTGAYELFGVEIAFDCSVLEHLDLEEPGSLIIRS